MGKPGQKISADDLVMMSPLFSVLPAPARSVVLERARPLSLDAGDPLYARGDASDRYFGILKGRLRLSVDSAEGKTVALNQADTGEWFGELGLFEGGSRLVDATAAEPTDLLCLSRDDMLGFATSEPTMFMPIVELLGARIQLVGELLQETVFHDVTFRLAKRLLDLAGKHGVPADQGVLIDLHLPQEELGQMVGATREAVGRQLSTWKKKAWIDVSYGKITVVNRAPLMQIIVSAQGGDVGDGNGSGEF